LAVASLVGPTFSLRLLRRVPDAADNPATLLDALDEALAAGVVAETAGRPGTYAFSHQLIQQTVADELTLARRARVHRRIGEALEDLPGAESHIEELARHFAEADGDGQATKAASYALAASQRARRELAFEASASHLERGLAALELERRP